MKLDMSSSSTTSLSSALLFVLLFVTTSHHHPHCQSFQHHSNTPLLHHYHAQHQSTSSPKRTTRQRIHPQSHLHPQQRIQFPTTTSPTALSLGISTITAPLGSISVLAIVILIHESGHFLAARSMGIKVKQFSVGVGPKIAGFRRFLPSEDGEEEEGEERPGIDFNLRAIPLGGYVEFPENYNATLQLEREIEGDEKRALIKRYAKEDGTDLGGAALRLLREEGRGGGNGGGGGDATPWWKFNRKTKRTQGKQGGVVIGDDGTITVPPIDYYTDPDLLQNRPWGERAIVLSGGVVFNLILAFTCFFGLYTVGGGLPKAVFNEGAIIGSVSNGAASVGLLNTGDVILGLNGESLFTTTSPSAFASQDAISKFISQIRQTTPGETLTLSVIKAKSTSPSEIQIKPQPLDKTDINSPPSIGVKLGPNYARTATVQATSLPDAIVKSTNEVTELSSEIIRATLTSLSALFSSSAPNQSLSGPIGVIKSGADVVSRNDYKAVVGFVAVLSINLAVINSLPFPALDGGQLVFVLVEAVTGRKVDQRLQEGINAAALLFLVALSATATVGDLTALGSALGGGGR